MLFRSQPAGPQTDPHDAIAAQLRDLAPRTTHDPQIEANHEPSQVEETPPSTEASQPIAEPLLPTSESSFHPAPSNDNVDVLLKDIHPARSYRGVLTVLLAICIGVAASVAWHSYGEEAKQRLAQLIPQTLLQVIPQTLLEAPASPQNATAAEAQDTEAQAAAPQPIAEAEPAQEAATAAPQPSTPPSESATTPTQAPPTQAALPAETAQSLEAMASDIAALKNAVEDLKAGQQQLRREIATAAEREAHPKPVQHRAKSAPPRRHRTSSQAAVPNNPPLPSPSPPQATEKRIHAQRDAYIPPPAPVPARLPPQPGDDSAPRPPMPLR